MVRSNDAENKMPSAVNGMVTATKVGGEYKENGLCS